MTGIKLDNDQAAELAEVFHLLGESNRLRLVCACLDEAVSVHDLAEQLGITGSLVSHHLRLLKAARLMRAEKRGRQVFYRAADEHVCRVLQDMTAHIHEDPEE
ncbi:MAG: metalloregulator ArsR/SmtB family transcription factor [Arenicellales bacterium]